MHVTHQESDYLVYVHVCLQLRIVVELVWPLLLFLILMWVKMDNTDLQERIHECRFCFLVVAQTL